MTTEAKKSTGIDIDSGPKHENEKRPKLLDSKEMITQFQNFNGYIHHYIIFINAFNYFIAKEIWPEDEWEPDPPAPGEMPTHYFWRKYLECKRNGLDFFAGLDLYNKSRIFEYIMQKTQNPSFWFGRI